MHGLAYGYGLNEQHGRLHMSSEPILSVDDMGRCADDGTWLLRHISIAVRAGERWAVAGPTGSGKTLLLRSLALLDAVDEGCLKWNGADIPNEQIPQFRRSIIYLHQTPVLIDGTVEANLALPFQLGSGGGSVFDRQQILPSLELLGQDAAFLKKSNGDLSGGEAQIVALLRAMQLNPSLLLLDEPTAALDAVATRTIETLVSRWLNESKTLRASVWVTHDPKQKERVADRSLWLEQGRLKEIADV